MTEKKIQKVLEIFQLSESKTFNNIKSHDMAESLETGAYIWLLKWHILALRQDGAVSNIPFQF